MALQITYVSWSFGTGYTTVSQSYNLGSSGSIQALSGTIVITNNDVGGSVTEQGTIYHSPSASYSFKVFKNTYTNPIYTDNFDITYASPTKNISQQTSLYSLLQNDKIYTELTRQKMEYSASISSSDSDVMRVYRTTGQVTLNDTTALTSIPTGSNGSFLQSISNNILCLTSSFTSYYSASSTFIPTSSSLYNTFGEVYEQFYFNNYDYLVTKNADGIRLYEIFAVEISGSNICVTVQPSFQSETIANLQYVVFLRKQPDETQVIVNYEKTEGNVSYGFIVPNNLHPDVLKNIDVITKEVKQKLIEINTGQA